MCVVYTCVGMCVVCTCVRYIHVCVWSIHVCACCSSTQPMPIMWGPKTYTESVPLLFSLGHLPWANVFPVYASDPASWGSCED